MPATLKKSTKKSCEESLKGKLFDSLETVDSYIGPIEKLKLIIHDILFASII